MANGDVKAGPLAFWVDAIKTLGVPVVVMGAFMYGGWRLSERVLTMGEAFIARAMKQMDEQTDTLKLHADTLSKINRDVADSAQRLDEITEHNARMLKQNEESLLLQRETCEAIKRTVLPSK